jgi:hypothetical protein
MKQLPEVASGVEYLDRLLESVLTEDPEADPWEALTTQELAWITDEVRKCRNDFRYAAGNYFWLSQTETADRRLIDLFDAQEILLELVLWFWSSGKPARIMVHKARQVGISTVCEALLAWRMIFFTDQIGMIVAQDPPQAQHLLNISLFIIDNLPWWMRPMEASREIKEYLMFDNPDPESRRIRPGLHNYMVAFGCNKVSSFGQGKKIHACHLSEIASYRPEWRAKEIIDGDILYALANAPGAFCIMESKPKGVGGYWYRLWQSYSQRGASAQFYPLFIPSFFEKTRSLPAPKDFQASEEEAQMRERYALDWKRCKLCGRFVSTAYSDSPECLTCRTSDVEPVMLSNDQLFWYREMKKSVEDDKERLRLFLQEMAVTAEEGFQVHGIHVFPDAAMHWVERCVRPGIRGFFSEDYQFHYGKRCPVCGQDHTNEEHPLQVWELPRKPEENAQYYCGVDVSEGSDEGDWSVIHMIRIGYMNDPDTQVLEWRGKISATELAKVCYILGRAYNNAMMAIEVRMGPGELTQWELMNKLGYTEIFRWKSYDTLGKTLTNKLGWVTNSRTRDLLITNAIRWLCERIWKPQSPEFLNELRTFVRDDIDASARAASGTYDDTVMAGMIAIFAAHESDFDPATSRIHIPGNRAREREEFLNWTCVCVCGNRWDVSDPRGEACPKCHRVVSRADRKGRGDEGKTHVDFEVTEESSDLEIPAYEHL